jgi:flagellar biosynthesis anti-sigma factor FlgM
MAININGNVGPQATGTSESSQVAATHREPSRAQSETGTSSAKDTVSLTEVSRQLPQLERQLNSLPVVDIQRVEDTRNQINNGTYSVNPDSIARKFSQLESLLPA